MEWRIGLAAAGELTVAEPAPAGVRAFFSIVSPQRSSRDWTMNETAQIAVETPARGFAPFESIPGALDGGALIVCDHAANTIPPEYGGLGLPLKDVQARLGHQSIVMTADRYGHLFPSRDDGSELARAESALFG